MKCSCFLLFLFLIAVPMPCHVSASLFSDIVVFGDSLSDVGNIHNVALDLYPPSPYWDGRFSNGPVWVEGVAQALGIDASTPFLEGGRNYAFGGAETGFDVPPLQSIIGDAGRCGMSSQVMVHATFGSSSGDDLFVLWGGGNDLLNGQIDPWIPAVNMVSNIAFLKAYTGANHFLVPNLPPLGQTPGHAGTVHEEILNQRAQLYNQYLNAVLDWVQATWTQTQIYRVDMFGLFQDMISDPAAVGLSNITEPAYNQDTGQIVSNVDEYLFWDNIHPTRRGHQLLADAALAALPDVIPPALTTYADMNVHGNDVLGGNEFTTTNWQELLDIPSEAPEPVTIAMLAMGGLFLRQRHRAHRC